MGDGLSQMGLQVQDILKKALALVGILDSDEAANPSDLKLALQAANMMIDTWSVKRLMLRSTQEISFPLIPTKQSYTIGQGADVAANKPIRVSNAFYRDGSGIDYPVELVGKQEFDSYSDKSVVNSNPVTAYYDPGLSQQTTNNVGTLYLYYAPDSSTTYTMFLACDVYLKEFAHYTDTVTFEPAYYEALIYNLALRLFRYFHTNMKETVPADLLLLAAASMKTIEALNSKAIIMSSSFAGDVGSRYNIFSDSYNR